MQRFIIIFFLLATIGFSTSAQKFLKSNEVAYENSQTSFKQGEWLKFRIHYGILNAGYATLNLKHAVRNGQSLHHAVGKGWTVGAARFFFQVDDNYESFFTKDDIKPIHFKRRVDEGGYMIRRDLSFNHAASTVTINDLEKKTRKQVAIKDVQDMISSFYYLRNIDLATIKEGDAVSIDMFFDGETYPFKLKFLKRETIKTKFGKIKTWKIRPLVQKGRVFEGEESLTIWITDDENKLPVRVKASLAVGSIKADLHDFKKLSHPFQTVSE